MDVWTGGGLSFLTMAALNSISMQAQQVTTPEESPFTYTRIYADSTGASHFGDEELAFALVNVAPRVPPVAATTPMVATMFVIIAVPPGGVADWHPVPQRQVNVILSGEVEVEVSDGEVRRFGPGSWVLGEDTWGQGHVTRVVSSDGARFVVLTLGDQ